VLKYGNPGESTPRNFWTFINRISKIYLGPISDTLVRKAYVAAYDRRLRHPAWVSWDLRKPWTSKANSFWPRLRSTLHAIRLFPPVQDQPETAQIPNL
jgi:hypothetical protein